MAGQAFPGISWFRSAGQARSFMSKLVRAWQARQNTACRVLFRLGLAGMSWHRSASRVRAGQGSRGDLGAAGRVAVRSGTAWQVGLGSAAQVGSGHGAAGPVSLRMVFRHGAAGQARFRSVWLVGVRQGRQGPEVWAVSVQAWRGRPSVARDGFSRLVTAVRVCPGCLRTAGRGRQGEARFYLVRHGRCGKARATCLGWHGRPGWARLHKSWEGASCRGKAARQWHGTSRLV
jgi:hypothetical protein